MLKSVHKALVILFTVQLLVGCSGMGDVADEPGVDSTGKSGAQQATPVKKTPMSKAELGDFQRALWVVKSGDVSKGLAEFEALTKKYPSMAEAHLNLGILRLKGKDLAGAEAALLRATQLNPNDAIAFNHLGVAYRYNGKFNESKNAYLSAIELNNGYSLAHLNLGILYDIYFQDLPAALNEYQLYKKLINQEDKTVDKWIIDLERRVAREKQAAKKG